MTSVTSVTRPSPLARILANCDPAGTDTRPDPPAEAAPTSAPAPVPPTPRPALDSAPQPPTRPAPPKGVRLFFEKAEEAHEVWPKKPRHWTCWPEEATHWTYEDAGGWFYTQTDPVPACEPALWARSKHHCKECRRRNLRVQWQVCKNNEKRLQVKCDACEAHVAYLARKSDNPDLEWRAV